MYHRMRYGNAVVVAVAALWVAVSCSNSTEPLIPDPDKAPAEYTKYLVDQAVSRYKTEGREATLAYYNSPESADGEWYVFIHDENDVIIAHPRSELLGRTRDQRIDANGHDYGAEFASATEEGKWVDYVFYNPETEEETLKHTWVVRHAGLLFGSGWYDEQP